MTDNNRKKISFAVNSNYNRKLFSEYDRAHTEPVRRVHKMAPGYKPTPLYNLETAAKAFGVKTVLIKDESERFGLKAFKGLGGFYAMFRVLCQRLGLNPQTAVLNDILNPQNEETLKNTVFITTTDGNHGKGVSWSAKQFGCRSIVYMPRGTVPARADAIRFAGNAEVTVTDMTYDECVAYTASLAEENGWYLLQDVAWDGYEDIPQYIMQGYTTLIYESAEQIKEKNFPPPTHLFLQAGVGSFAAAAAAAADYAFGNAMPCVSLVEPTEVACFFESFLNGDGMAHTATGNGETVMAGLNCATPCSLAWKILVNNAEYAFSCPDKITEDGMYRLFHPAGSDQPIISGESGAVPFGLLEALSAPEYEAIKSILQLGPESVILLVNTEGATDPEHFDFINKYK